MRLKLLASSMGLIFAGLAALGALGSPHPKKEQPKHKTLTVSATAYCLRGRTATGTRPRKGTVAVDPRIIPLGSVLFVEGYGWAKAEDTGSAIKGRRIDIWLPSRKQALKWGVKRVKVVVYHPPTKAKKTQRK